VKDFVVVVYDRRTALQTATISAVIDRRYSGIFRF
jgi:hypothetical protein